MRRRLVLTLVAAGLPLSLVACSETTSADPAQALEKAKTTLDQAKAVTLNLKSDSPIPSGSDGVSAAEGTGLIDAATPKFSGKVSAVVRGAPVTTDVVTVGKDTWMKLFSQTFTKVDLKDLNAPDPGAFFVPGTGLSSLLDQVTAPSAGKQERYGKEVLDHYTGAIPGSVVKGLLNLGADSATFDADFGILPETGELRLAKLTGPFYDSGETTYTVVLTDYGKTIDITAP